MSGLIGKYIAVEIVTKKDDPADRDLYLIASEELRVFRIVGIIDNKNVLAEPIWWYTKRLNKSGKWEISGAECQLAAEGEGIFENALERIDISDRSAKERRKVWSDCQHFFFNEKPSLAKHHANILDSLNVSGIEFTEVCTWPKTI